MSRKVMTPFSYTPLKNYVLEVNRFGGVDYTSQRFNVANNRAIDEMNYIYKDGVVQKRNGIEDIFQVNTLNYIAVDFDNVVIVDRTLDGNTLEIRENPTNVNNIWKFKAEDNKEHIVAHIGRLLYEIKNIEDSEDISIEPIIVGKNNTGDIFCFEYLNEKTNAFVREKMLWFLGGNKFVVIRFINDVVRVEPAENYASVPVTTQSITYKNSIASGRASLDNVNLLTPWRYNKLLSGTTKNEDEKTTTKYYEYTLDAPLIVKDDNDMAEFSLVIEEMQKDSGVIE